MKIKIIELKIKNDYWTSIYIVTWLSQQWSHIGLITTLYQLQVFNPSSLIVVAGIFCVPDFRHFSSILTNFLLIAFPQPFFFFVKNIMNNNYETDLIDYVVITCVIYIFHTQWTLYLWFFFLWVFDFPISQKWIYFQIKLTY